MSQTYLLKYDEEEAERLTQQHKMWTDVLEYKIHPSILAQLPPNPRVADVATGNGAWMLDVAASHAQPSWTLDGFDISSAQFPTQDKIAGNIHFHESDMKKPFPASLLQQYDLVHVRLVLVALEATEWRSTLANLCTLLKPGGWLQWEEADVRPASVVLKGHLHSKTEAVQKLMDGLLERMHDKMPPAADRFKDAFMNSSLDEVGCGIVACDRVPEYRALGTRVLMGVAFAVVKQHAKKTGDAESLRQFETLLAEANEEVEDGAYVTYRINAFRGQQNLSKTVQ